MNQTSKQQSILLVEDEGTLISLYAKILTDAGYKVVSVSNGEDALKHMVKGGFDLVLLDIMLPQLDGFEIIEQSQKKKAKQAINTIVIMTNLSQEKTIAKGVELGVKGYIIKSDYNPEEFLNQIKEFLG